MRAAARGLPERATGTHRRPQGEPGGCGLRLRAVDLSRRGFALGTLGLLPACGSSPGPSAQAQVRSGTTRRVALGGLTAAGLADAQRSFGVDLLGKLCTARGNTTLSPVSAALALGLLSAGARGDTEKRLSALLHLPRWGEEVVAAYAAQHELLGRLASQLQLANRVYSAPGKAPSGQTLDDSATAFRAVLTQLDFAGDPQRATARINADVARDTAGLIPKLFEAALSRDVVTVLVNAVHLKADWAEPFLRERTTQQPFTTGGGRTVTVPMMTGAFGRYRQDGGWASVALPYVGGKLEMVAVLPPSGATCDGLTADRLTRLARGASDVDGELSMPKVDLSQTHQLLEVLTSLGLEAHGDYSGYGASEISEVVQKDVLRVDEKGTEAAAATGVVMATGARFSPKQLVLDRPYLLLLQDVQTGTPLFLAHVVDPTA